MNKAPENSNKLQQIPSHNNINDIDPIETKEWIDSIDSVVQHSGIDRANFLINKLIDDLRRNGANLAFETTSSYINTIPLHQQERRNDADLDLERKIRSYIRWNALVMVVKANLESSELGGHIASSQSSMTLYDVGFNYFFRGNDYHPNGGDMIFFQGHASPTMYARSYLEGVISEDQLLNFRQEVDGKGLSSYPHPRLMPDYWQFPTVSMGLGPIMSIYQARFMFYLEHRGLIEKSDRKVWAFLGDGEMDEPESLGAISLAGREKLDNLVFVINCNLQRLDGPVRGNGKIIQELESVFHGAGWNVIKVIWGSGWDALLARDKTGLLLKRMTEVVDGDYQKLKSKDGAFVRKHFFGAYPELLELVKHMSDDEIFSLARGGHDSSKVYAAYHRVVNHPNGKPSVILVKTVKGYGMGSAGEGQNTTHSQKKMTTDQLVRFRDRFSVPLSDKQVENLEFYKPPVGSSEANFIQERRKELGGFLPERRVNDKPLKIGAIENLFANILEGSKREMSTTMAFVRALTSLCKDKDLGKYIVPIVPDEARTFGMEGLFRQLGIYSSSGQLYEPEDSDKMLWYKEDEKGQILQEGINEAGAVSEWIAAATSYANHGVNMIPMYIFYSMFGLQRTGDLCWAAGDLQARGFLLGATSGRTTLAGEGLQHQDGHSHILSSTIPSCVSYDPTFSYELAVILHYGLIDMYQNQNNVFYYITLMNENYAQPEMPKEKDIQENIIKGMYLLSRNSVKAKSKGSVDLISCGSILNETLEAAKLLAEDWQIQSNIFSATSFTQMAREGYNYDRNKRFSLKNDKKPHFTSILEKEGSRDKKSPVVCATDYMRSFAEQVRFLTNRPFYVLGTDGFGRSDLRVKLRSYFEVNRYHIVVCSLNALVEQGIIEADLVKKAIKKYNIDVKKPNPLQLS